ncbi:hypothetical protein RRG08_049817 [Elysia crispata]|uniref:Uncharacterized protein n=1 Tax=Elysia crispata TaxID=231223 RepID=A0AAE0XPK8_9GAST|nr:hypothetical protein RRG08_049817 [Elysia crispata]
MVRGSHHSHLPRLSHPECEGVPGHTSSERTANSSRARVVPHKTGIITALNLVTSLSGPCSLHKVVDNIVHFKWF